MATRNYQSIGEVLVSVKTEFPDITISKIRFLESEGLIEPERTPSGYRKFYEKDVDRLKSILRMQRDEYLPLKVIKDRLLQHEGLDGQVDVGGPVEPEAPEPDEELAEPPTGLQMSIEEMSRRDRHRPRADQELESYGLVCSHGPEARPVLRRRRLHRALDREGLLPLRRRAAAPHDVQALRRARGGRSSSRS